MGTGIVCPLTEQEWKNAVRASNCAKEEEYHCLRNENGKYTKKCIRKVWVQAGMCPEYNTVANKIDVDNCMANREECPSKTYWSNEVYNYPKCIELSVMKSTPVPVTRHPTDKQPNTDSNNTQPIIIAASLGVAVLIIALTVICICIVKRRKQRKRDPSDIISPRSTKSVDENIEATERMLNVNAAEDLKGFTHEYMRLKQSSQAQTDKSDFEAQTDKSDFEDEFICHHADLECNGIIIYVSNDKGKVARFINRFTMEFKPQNCDYSKISGQMRDDKQLYIFRDALGCVSNKDSFRKMNEIFSNIYKKTKDMPKKYIILEVTRTKYDELGSELWTHPLFRKDFMKHINSKPTM